MVTEIQSVTDPADDIAAEEADLEDMGQEAEEVPEEEPPTTDYLVEADAGS